MGQYYLPVNVDKMQYLYSHDFNNGLKLMEHSYIGNNFMEAVEKLISPGGAWYRCHLVWAGDYAEAGKYVPEDDNYYEEEDGTRHIYNLYGYANDKGTNAAEIEQPDREQLPYEERVKILEEASENFKSKLPEAGKYLVNWTKKQYVNLNKEEPFEICGDQEWIIHPLSLLTSSGNGSGGGDYWGNKGDLIGSWAGDEISMEHLDRYVPEDLEEIGPLSFREGEE